MKRAREDEMMASHQLMSQHAVKSIVTRENSLLVLRLLAVQPQLREGKKLFCSRECDLEKYF